MSEPLASFPAIPERLLDEGALVCRAAGPEVQTDVLAGAALATEAQATDQTSFDLVGRMVRYALLNGEFQEQTAATLSALLAQAWNDKGENFDANLEAFKTAILHPLDFGESFLGAFFGFYLQDLIATAKLIYETALLLGYMNECLGTASFSPGAEGLLELSRYLQVGHVLGPEQACKPLQDIVAALDRIVTDVSKYFDEEGNPVKLLNKAADVVEEVLNFLIDLMRALPAMAEGPLKDYQTQLVSDPVALGRVLGITSAIVIGFACGIEELLVLSTGIKALRPIVVVGGIIGAATASDDAASETAPLIAYGVISGAPIETKVLLKAFGGPTEQEFLLIRWLISAFLRARDARRLEMAGVELADATNALMHRIKLPELIKRGYRAVDEASLLAARDLAQHHREIAALIEKMAPLIRRAIENTRYRIADYGVLRRLLNPANEQLERLYYLAQVADRTPLQRLDMLSKTAELQGSLFEAAHIVDKAFINTEKRAAWASTRRFQLKRPTWFKAGQALPEKMPAISLLATEHRVLARSMTDVWGVMATTIDVPTLTHRMEELIVFADDASDVLAEATRRGAFIVKETTTATEIVKAQRLIYESYFPEIFSHIRPQLDEVLTALDEAVELAWKLPGK